MPIMLQIYRRHTKTCPHSEKGRAFTKCKCPIWVDNGKPGKQRVNRSMNTTVWTRANDALRDMELGVEAAQFALVTVRQACERFLADAEARRLAHATTYKMRSGLVGSEINRMADFRKAPALATWAESNGVRFMQDWSLERLESYRATWKDSGQSSLKRHDLLKSFFRWALEHGMVRKNFAAGMRSLKPRPSPTLPYTQDEFQRLLDGCSVPSRNEQPEAALNRARLRALLLIIRYSGLRISDALSLTEDRIRDGRIQLYQAKTGEPVSIPIPKWLVATLQATPKEGPYRWWMRPTQSLKNAHEHWRRKLEKVAAKAKVANPGFHRLRDTFAVEMLLAGVPLHQVSILLGHTSIKITEQHYAPWVRERQAQMDAIVAAAWRVDPTAQRQELEGTGDHAKN